MSLPGTSTSNLTLDETKTDWEKCIFCQSDTSDTLQCPENSKRKDKGVGYKTVAEKISEFHELGALPPHIQIERLNNGEGICATLQQNSAKWHNSCRLKFNETELKRARKRKRPESSHDIYCREKFTRSSSSSGSQRNQDLCLFCDTEGSDVSPLRNASTFGLDRKLRDIALKLEDEKLLAKLSPGDIIAVEVKYHAKCLIGLYNKARATDQKSPDIKRELAVSTTFAELVAYIEDMREDSDNVPVFKVAELMKLFDERMKQKGFTDFTSHSTRLRQKLQSYFPNLNDYKQGRDILLVFV